MCIKQIKKLFFKDLKKMIEIKQLDGSFFQTNENVLVLNLRVENRTNKALKNLSFCLDSLFIGEIISEYEPMYTISSNNNSFVGMTFSRKQVGIKQPFELKAKDRIEGNVIIVFTNMPEKIKLCVYNESNSLIGDLEVDMQIKRISYNANN